MMMTRVCATHEVVDCPMCSPFRYDRPTPDRPRYERVADYLRAEIERAKPSLSPEAYPDLDPFLLGFERGLERAQHIIEVSARYALTQALHPESDPPGWDMSGEEPTGL